MQFNNEVKRGNRNILFKGNNNALLDFSRDRVNNFRTRQKENRANIFIGNRRGLTIPIGTKFDDNDKENNEKTSKKLSKTKKWQLFMARYEAWKKQKDERKALERQNKLKPFISAAWPTTQQSIGSVWNFKFEIKKKVVMTVPKTLTRTKKNTNFVEKAQETKSQNAAGPFAIRSIPSVHLKTVPIPANPTKLARNFKQEKLSHENKNEKIKFLKPTNKPENREKILTSSHRKNSLPGAIVLNDISISPIRPIPKPEKFLIAVNKTLMQEKLSPEKKKFLKPIKKPENREKFLTSSHRKNSVPGAIVLNDISISPIRPIPKPEEFLIDVNKTPMQTREKDNPTNYMSPNVMVCMGKFYSDQTIVTLEEPKNSYNRSKC